MIINVSYGSSVTSLNPTLEADYESAVQQAVQFYETEFTNNVTVNLSFGYGFLGNTTTPVASTATAQNIAEINTFTYSQVLAAAQKSDIQTGVQLAAVSSLPGTDPTGGGRFEITTAEQKALGLGTFTGLDGIIGLSSVYQYSWNEPTISPNTVDAVGALEHEISEVLGRVDYGGQTFGGPTHEYTLMDMFRYASPGVRDEPFVAGYNSQALSYFSYNGTQLENQYDLPANVANGADIGDWAPSVQNDSYGYPVYGEEEPVTSTDLQEMNVLGWTLQTPPTPPVPPTPPIPPVPPTPVKTNILNNVTGTNFLGGAVPGFLLVSTVGGGETLASVGANGSTSNVGEFGAGWAIDAAGDTGQANIFLEYDANGQRNLFVAEMNGNQIGAVNPIGEVGEDWSIVGAGDFDGNGSAGILIQQDMLGFRTLQFLPVQNGSSSAPVLTAAVPDSWQVDAIGPLTANPNQDDILMSYTDTAGQQHIEALSVVNGASQTPQQIGVFGAGWQVDGIGNFNGGSIPEILLEDDVGSSRYLFAATLANGSIASEFLLGVVGDNVNIDGIGKFNGDGTSDIAFNYTNNQTGQNTMGFYRVEHNAIVGTHLSGATGLSWAVS
jgi:hypothetical protein